MTRQQRYLEIALRHVRGVKAGENTQTAGIYGGLCHTFPVLVRTCGLCQAVAFAQAKAAANGERGRAYTRLCEHIKEQLGITENDLPSAVATAAVADYMRHTRTVLQAWVYYKRFAASILDVDAAPTRDAEEVAP
jgi:CRISPR-associated protein Cmr5